MASPQDYLRDPEWHARPIDQREKDLIAADPQEFGKFDQERRLRIIKNAEKKYGKRSAPAPSVPESFGQRVATDLSIGWQQGKSSIENTLANITNLVGAKGATQSLREAAVRDQAPPDIVSRHQSVTDQVIQGIGSAPATIAKYAPAALAKRYAPLAAGAIGVVSSLDKGKGEAVKEGIKDAATFGLLGKAAKLPTMAGRVAGSAAASGATAAVFEGGDVKQSTSAAILGGLFGAAGGKKTEAMTPEKARQILEGGVGAVSAARDMIRREVAPQNRGPEARKMAGIIRANVSDINRQSDIANHALEEAQKSFRLMPDEQRLSVIHAIEKGDPQSDVSFKTLFGNKTVEGKKMQEFVDTMRQIHNGVRDELINEASRVNPETGKLEPTALKSVADAIRNPNSAMKSYYLNYFPHLFTDPEAAAKRMQQYYSGKRPLPGPATFLHERSHPTIEDALWTNDEFGQRVPTGLKLVTTDPVEAYMLKWREMKRFTAAQRIIKDMHESDLVQWIPPGKRGPSGWVQVSQDGAGRAFQRMKKSKGGSLDVTGYAWAPEPAARVLNNYLSPGLRGYAPVRAAMSFNNVLNQAQLGMSGFHLGFTGFDSVTSRFALGLEQMFEGTVKHPDPKMFAKGVSNTIKAAIFPWSIAENMKLGMEMRKEWRSPGSSKNPEVARLVSMMQEAGGGMSLDPVYRTNMTHKLTEAIRNHNGFVRTAWRIPFAVNEQLANLIMDKFVPIQKMGVFADLARFELERLPHGAPQPQIREVMGRAWDSVDNRMGMLRYDNLFWNKAVKDLAMLTTRSVGWNLGTLREIGGGLMDISKLKNREMSHRLAYTVSLPFMTGLLGGLIHYAYNGKPPEQPMDYFFPRTGRRDEFNRDERISIPSYMKDIYHMYVGGSDLAHGLGPKKLIGVAGAKMHPSFSLVSDMLANHDFYNTEIYNSHDPLIKRATDVAEFLGKQFTPFSATNISRERKLGVPMSEQALTMVGFVPAPADIKKTPAERLATDIMAERLPKRAIKREERERQDRIRDIERKIRTGDNWKASAQQALEEGALSDQDIRHAVDLASGLPLDRSFNRMTLEDAMQVYKVANQQEKPRLRMLFEQKVERNADRISAMAPAKRARLAKEILEILNDKTLTPPPGR